jgi:hypothetical protein
LNTTLDEVDKKLRNINLQQYLCGDTFTKKNEEIWSGEAIAYQMVWPFPADSFNVSHPVVHIIIM